MELETIKSGLFEKLIEAQIIDEPGAVIYSGDETLRPGKYLFFGLNPGGTKDEDETIRQHFTLRASNHNEYVDGVWSPGGYSREKGMAPLQKRIQFLFASLCQNARNICAGNLVFLRSRNIESLDGQFNFLANKCWPTNQRLIEVVNPDLVLVMGNDSYQFLRTKLENQFDESEFPSGHGDWVCRSVSGTLVGKRRQIVCIPHLSRYNIKTHPEVISWIKSLSANYLN